MNIFQAINKKSSCSVKSISMCIPLYLAPKILFHIFKTYIRERVPTCKPLPTNERVRSSEFIIIY